jgi:hypothetical protein
MCVHVGGADCDIAADQLGRVHVGIVGRVVAPVHLQHRIPHLGGLDDPVAATKNIHII